MRSKSGNVKTALTDWFRGQGINGTAQKIILEEFCKVSGFSYPKHSSKNFRPARVHSWRQDHVIKVWPMFMIWWQANLDSIKSSNEQMLPKLSE